MERKGRVVVNPYAKKRAAPKPPPQAAVFAAAPAAGAWPSITPATFSQAFGYENSGVTSPPPLQQNAAIQQNVEQTAHPNLTDRESHVLLQPHVLYVSHKQKGNGILPYIRNVPTAFSRMVPDYIMSPKRCAIFLSCKYHSLYPQYIHRRIAELGNDFELRLLLVLIDVEDNANTLRTLNKVAVVNNLTLILAWSEEEAARYLETFKAFDGKDASLIQKREQSNFVDQVADFLTTCKGVNKTDSASLLGQFGSIQKLTKAGPDDLALIPGMGEVKVRRLYDALHKPFSKHKAAKRKRIDKEKKEAAKAPQPDESDTNKEGGAKCVVESDESEEDLIATEVDAES
jgi:DNA excision repair protein ERCC-1